ncbi:heavy metal sensor histidine kinase [Calditrichota bacterium LG25]
MTFKVKNIRTRLTLWYVAVFTLILVVYAVLSLSLVYWSMRQDLDNELEEDYEILENIISVEKDGAISVNENVDPYFRERWIEIWDASGKKLYESRPFTAKILPPVPDRIKKAGRFTFYSQALPDGGHARFLFGKANINGRWLFVRLVKSEDQLWDDLADTARVFLLALPFSLFLAGFGGFLLTRKLLSPIDRMTEKARRISEENLQERLPVINADDELGHLARTFNKMLERIEKSFARLKQFTADAAHELRTPLTAIQSIGEVSLQENKDAAYYRNVIGSMLEENHRLTQLVDSLLFLSRADCERIKVSKEPFSLFSFIEKTVELIQPLAEEKNQTILLEGDRRLNLTADKNLLREALLNILDNAIKYSGGGTTIRVRFERIRHVTQISVTDQGPGIPVDQQEKIFERFYRVDKARSREIGGIGLGLAIARWTVRAQGGNIRVKSQPEAGSTFIIELPDES